MIPILVYGASGHGKVVADTARRAGHRVVGFCDDDAGKRGLVLGADRVVAVGVDEAAAVCAAQGVAVALGIGDNRARQRLVAQLDARSIEVTTIHHPAAVVAESVTVGRGSVIFAGVVINPDSTLGIGVIANTSCSIDHDNAIGDFAHISPGAHLGGTVRVGEGTHVGLGASVRNNVEIGSWTVVGAGAAVVSSISDGVVAVGVPARETHTPE